LWLWAPWAKKERGLFLDPALYLVVLSVGRDYLWSS
jgi:hypothetical protein